MPSDLLMIEASFARMTSWLIQLHNAVLKIDVDEAVDRSLWRPLDKSRLRSIHCSDE